MLYLKLTKLTIFKMGELMKLVISLLLLLFAATNLYPQDQLVSENLKLVAMGKVDEVKNKIPDLLVEYPNNPGIILLHAVVIEDAYKALDLYRDIVSNFPSSQWADDAYWRIVQFYAVAGDLPKAKSELNNFRAEYPASTFLGPAADVVRSAESVQMKGKRNSANMNVTKRKTIPTALMVEEAPPKELNENSTIKDTDIIESDKIENNKELSISDATTEKEITESDNAQPGDEAFTIKSDETKVINTDPEAIEEKVVKEEAIEEKQVNELKIPEGTSGYYGLQVGIYSDKANAEDEKNKFIAKRMRTEVLEKSVSGKSLYAVVIGNYSSMESAKAAKIIVQRQCNCEPVIFQK